MRIYTEQSLKDFKSWGGAFFVMEVLSDDQLGMVEKNLNELYPDGLSNVELNEFLSFDIELIAEWLGFENWDNLVENQM